jgi:hypothetical protein
VFYDPISIEMYHDTTLCDIIDILDTPAGFSFTYLLERRMAFHEAVYMYGVRGFGKVSQNKVRKKYMPSVT